MVKRISQRALISSFKSLFLSLWRYISVSLQRRRRFADGHPGKAQDIISERRNYPRFPVTDPVICYRYGRQMNMRPQNISLGGLKLEANFDLGIGESMDLAILTKGARISRIYCRGRILAIEDFKNKVHARLCFSFTSDMDFRELSDYLEFHSRGSFHKWVMGGLFILSAYIAYRIIRTYFVG
ncbi:MAG: PilZ domain-containing protein [Thermodesulfobacteriota bacterium]